MAHLNQRRQSLIPSSLFSSIPRPLILQAVALGVMVILAAWLRWYYILHVQPYPDEFVTLLAVKMILQKGLPLLPSGLFYDHGLLFSYAGSLASALFGFSREAVRATSLVFDLLTVLLVWHVGRRWFSAEAGLVAAILMAVAPTAVLWGGRARMYALLQLLVLLTLYCAFAGANPLGTYASRFRRLALFGYLGATLTQFVSIALIPPLALGTVVAGWLQARQTGERPWFRSRRVWWEVGGLAIIVLVAFLVKRMGQPKSIAPLQLGGGGILTGIAQVVAIYGAFSTDLAASWDTLAPFFIAPEAIAQTLLALLAIIWCGVNLVRRRTSTRDLATLFLALILAATTVEMIFFVAADRRDDKYLVMLLPVLFLLAADGATRLIKFQIPNLKSANQPSAVGGQQSPISNLQSPILSLAICLLLVIYTWPFTSALLARSGSNYDTAFGYVRDHWKPGDKILTGTPAAAAIYLGRNDYYAVEGSGGYAYRILQRDGQQVDRWLGSPWLETDEQLRAAFDAAPRVWLVLERWGLIKEYYSPLTMQRILAMTDFVREDNGVVVLRSRPAAALIPENPSASLVVNFDNQLALQGYDLTWQASGQSRQLSLVLYWQALGTIPYDYTVFVHLRDAAGRNVAQADHQPLAPIYPPTLWPAGQTIRERSVLTLPEGIAAGTYNVWVGLYRLDTLERLPVAGGTSSDNAVSLGEVVVQ